MIGPRANPILATIAQTKIIQTRSLALYISSMLPATTIAGMAEKNPQKNRTTVAAATKGSAAIMTQKT